MSGCCFRALMLTLLLSLTTAGFSLQTRRAVVIGNDTYPGNMLRNARNDAQAIATSLKNLSYTTTLALDVDRPTMIFTLNNFYSSVLPGDIVLVYYAGHGLQLDGENYLIPTDFRVSSASEVPQQGYSLHDVIQNLSRRGASTEIVILDACRDNPFLGSRSLRAGWADVITSAGTFLAFGTAPGSTASDDPDDGHGLFTQYLLQHLASESNIEQTFQQVRLDVIKSSGGRQVPWTASSLVGTFHINPRDDEGAPGLKLSGLDLREAGNIDQGRYQLGEAPSRSRDVSPGVNLDIVQEDHSVADAITEVRGLHLDKALKILQAVLSVDPKCSLALRIMGVIYQLIGRSADATRALDEAVLVNPADALSRSYLCWVKVLQEASSSGLNCDQAVSLGDTLPEAHFGLALSLAVRAKSDQAVAEATRAIDLDPTSRASLSLRGDLSLMTGRETSGHDDFSRAARLTLQRAE